MKSISILSIAFILSAACLPVSSAHAKPTFQVLVKYEVFRLPQKAAEALQASKPSDPDLYAAVQKSVKAGSATADKPMLLHTTRSLTAILRQVDEWRSPEMIKKPAAVKIHHQTLGEELEITPVEPEVEGEGLGWEVQSSSTQLGPVKDGTQTFVTAPITTRLTVLPDQPGFLGALPRKPADDSGTVALAFLTYTAHHFAEAEDANNVEAPQRFRAEFDVISVPTATAITLLDGTPDHTELYGKLQNLISAKTAKLETLQLMQMKLGQRCKVEHIDEFPYPSDFDPAQSPQQVTITDPVLRELLMKPNAQPSPLPAPNGGSNLIVPPAPTTFQVRNLGDTLEMETSGNRDGSITVAISALKVRLLSMQNYDGIKQPCVREQSIRSEVRMGVNSTILLGTMNRPLPTGAPGSEADDRVWLAFLTLRK